MLAGLLAAATLLSVQSVAVGRVRDLQSGPSAARASRAEERAFRWTPEAFRVLTLGHVQSAVDGLLVRAFLEDPAASSASGKFDASAAWLDLASRLDPAFFELHQNGALFLSVVRQDPRGGLALAERANEWRKTVLPGMPASFQERFWKGAWSLPVIIAYLYLFELEDLPRAGAAFREAAELPRAPAYLRPLADRFQQPGGVYEAGLRILGFLIPTTQEGPEREKMVQKRNMLAVHAELWKVNQAFSEYLLARKVRRERGTLERAWTEFRSGASVPERDPMGGRLDFNPATGRIETTTPLVKVFGVG